MDNRQAGYDGRGLEHLIEHGPDDIATVFGRAFELAMRLERERFPGAGLYERTAERQGYANGYMLEEPRATGDQRQPSCPTPTTMLAAVSSRRSGVARP